MQNLLSLSWKKVSAYALVSAFAIGSILSLSANAAADDILGEWYNGTKEAKIQIYKSGSEYSGKIIWLKVPNENGKPKVDDKNPDPAKRNNKTLGLVILKDFVNTKDNKWEKGTIYDPKNGKEYSCEMTLKTPKVLDVRGYIGFSFIGRTDTWTRP